MNNYFIWEKSNIYTNFGSADLWILNKEYGQFNKFDDRVLSIGMLNNKTYNDKLVQIMPLNPASSKVIQLTYRQNNAQEPLLSFYNPMHKFVKTSGETVYAKDVKPGDTLVAIQSEVIVTYVSIEDQNESIWYVLSTAGQSPNIFINMLLTFPSTTEELEQFELSLNAKAVDELEYKV